MPRLPWPGRALLAAAGRPLVALALLGRLGDCSVQRRHERSVARSGHSAAVRPGVGAAGRGVLHLASVGAAAAVCGEK